MTVQLSSGVEVVIEEMHNDDGLWYGTSYTVQAPYSAEHYNALVEFIGEDEFYRQRDIADQLVYTFLR